MLAESIQVAPHCVAIDGARDAYESGLRRKFRSELRRRRWLDRWANEHSRLRLVFCDSTDGRLLLTTTSSATTTHYSLETGYDPTCRRIVPGMVIRCLMLARAFSDEIVAYDFPIRLDCAWKREWTNARQERLFLHVFAPAALGSLDRAVFAYGSPARRNILALNFWFAGPRPCLLAAEFPWAAALRKSLTGLPMHQEPDSRELERIVDVVPGSLESA